MLFSAEYKGASGAASHISLKRSRGGVTRLHKTPPGSGFSHQSATGAWLERSVFSFLFILLEHETRRRQGGKRKRVGRGDHRGEEEDSQVQEAGTQEEGQNDGR